MDSTTITLAELALACAAIALGGTLKGATGAGAPVVGVPVLAMLFDVPFAVAVFAMPNLVSNIWQGWQFRRDALPARFTWVYALGGGIGAAFGAWLLATAPPAALLLAMSSVVFLYIGFRLLNPNWVLGYARAERLVFPVGTLAGVLQGATGVSAPISVTYLNAMRLARPVFIATISVFFAVMSATQTPAMAAFGILTWDRFVISLIALIPLFAFMLVGAWLARHISREVFDRVILALLALIALRLAWVALVQMGGVT